MHAADILALTGKELDRMKLIERWKNGVLTQEQAAAAAKLSVRQFRRISRRYEAFGASGLQSGRRGRQADKAIAIVKTANTIETVGYFDNQEN